MSLPGYQEWIQMFDKDISKIWQSEHGELQQAAMLFGAFQKELQTIQGKIEKDLFGLRKQLEEKKILEKKIQLTSTVSPKGKKRQSPKYQNKENEPRSPKPAHIRQSEVESPDLFRNINNFPYKADIIDLSVSDDDNIKIDDDITSIDNSPTISRKHRLKQSDSNADEVKRNIFQKESYNDMTVIDCTPEAAKKKTDTSKIKKSRPKSSSTATLTQAISKSYKRKVKPVDSKVKLDNSDSDETFYNENSDEEQMQLTDLLNYINKDEAMEMDVTEEGLESYNTPNKKPKMISAVQPEPVVRGNERKKLNGFSCEKCAKFYGNMNLSPEELKKKMDQCSKHRYKYQPPEETMPGFWDLSFKVP